MNQPLRRLAASVGIIYADGSRAQTLIGTDFFLTKTGAELSLSIDLSNNHLPRNKGLPCYAEAADFLSRHEQLQSIVLTEKNLVAELESLLRLEMTVGIELLFGSGHRFSYDVTADLAASTVQFAVRSIRKTAA